MMKKSKNPRIRFKGFTDDWEQRKFFKIAQRESNIQISSPEFPSVEYEDVIPEVGLLNKDISVKDTKKQGIIFDGSQILYGKLRPYLHNWLNPDFNGVAVGDWWVLKPIETDKDFLYRVIQTSKFDDITKQSSGSKMPRADWNLVANTEFMLPISIAEQKKIGIYFNQLDNLITLHQRKLEKLELMKKSLLQKMFPKSGNVNPKIRFKGYTDDWEQRKVGEICSISTGKSNTQDKVDSGKYPFYVRSPIIEHSEKYLYDEEAVLTVGDGVGTGKVFHYVNGKYDLHQRVYRMYNFSDCVDARFFYEWFSKNFYKRVMSMTAKTSVDSVRYDMISEMDMRFPLMSEQIKIADFLFLLEQVITLHQRKLEKLKLLKKTLLQDMFPSE